MDEQTREQVRRRAYELFLARAQSGSVGDAEGDWLQAEQDIIHRNTGAKSDDAAGIPGPGDVVGSLADAVTASDESRRAAKSRRVHSPDRRRIGQKP